MFSLTSAIRRAIPMNAPSRALAVPNLALKQVSLASSVTALRTLKTRTSVKKFCKDCYMVKRKGRVYVYCKANGKHKQRQG